MSIGFSGANASRVESTRAEGTANLQRAVDVNVFTSWLDAVNSDQRDGSIPPIEEAGYVRVDGTFVGVLFRPNAARVCTGTECLAGEEASFHPDRSTESLRHGRISIGVCPTRRRLPHQHRRAPPGRVRSQPEWGQLCPDHGRLRSCDLLCWRQFQTKREENRWITISMAMVLFAGALTVSLILPVIPPF